MTAAISVRKTLYKKLLVKNQLSKKNHTSLNYKIMYLFKRFKTKTDFEICRLYITSTYVGDNTLRDKSRNITEELLYSFTIFY